jgi:hypothetical protein
MEEAINTLAIHKCGSVISVGQNIRFHWQPGPHGLMPVLYPRTLVRDQKWVTYEERGGIYALDVENLRKSGNFLGDSVSFIELDEKEGLRIESDFTLSIADSFLRERATMPEVLVGSKRALV